MVHTADLVCFLPSICCQDLSAGSIGRIIANWGRRYLYGPINRSYSNLLPIYCQTVDKLFTGEGTEAPERTRRTYRSHCALLSCRVRAKTALLARACSSRLFKRSVSTSNCFSEPFSSCRFDCSKRSETRCSATIVEHTWNTFETCDRVVLLMHKVQTFAQVEIAPRD